MITPFEKTYTVRILFVPLAFVPLPTSLKLATFLQALIPIFAKSKARRIATYY